MKKLLIFPCIIITSVVLIAVFLSANAPASLDLRVGQKYFTDSGEKTIAFVGTSTEVRFHRAKKIERLSRDILLVSVPILHGIITVDLANTNYEYVSKIIAYCDIYKIHAADTFQLEYLKLLVQWYSISPTPNCTNVIWTDGTVSCEFAIEKYRKIE